MSSSHPAIALAATFTASPVEESMLFWFQKLSWKLDLKFCDYPHLFQSLADPSSPLREPGLLARIILIRLQDLSNQQSPGLPGLEDSLKELASWLDRLSKSSKATTWLCICPPSPRILGETWGADRLQKGMSSLKAAMESIPGIRLLDCLDLPETRILKSIDDSHSDELAQIPYRQEFFDALGTALIRKLNAHWQPARKVIVLDADGTLWNGVCAEDGVEGVVIDEHRRHLHQHLLELRSQGKLLALCSRNAPEDVFQVLSHKAETILRPEHFTANRINWEPKSVNLRSLAAELNLGVSSFVFIDDDPVQCAEVLAELPEVLTLRLPSESGSALEFVKRIWALDSAGEATAEDQNRAIYAQQERQRVESRESSPTLESFIQGLNLQIEIFRLTAEHLPRASQLTYRTTQFNTDNERRTEQALKHFLETPKNEGWAVTAKDRFGDYGLVGLLLWRQETDHLCVKSMLLSCRALGRGVEHAMARHIGRSALGLQLSQINFVFNATSRNRPAEEFLSRIAGAAVQMQAQQPGGFSVAAASLLNLQPGLAQPRSQENREKTDSISRESFDSKPSMDSELAQWIAEKLGDVSQLSEELRSKGHHPTESKSPLTSSPLTPVHQTLQRIWEELMGVENIGIHDNFFELGGHSITVIQSLSRIRERLGVVLPIQSIFDSPSIAELAQLIEQASHQQPASSSPKPSQSLTVNPAGPDSSAVVELASLPQHRVLDLHLQPEPPSGITTIAIPTKNRPVALRRVLESLLQNTRKNGRDLRILVMDDSTTRQGGEQCKATIDQVNQSQGASIQHAGMAARATLAKVLAERAGVEPALLNRVLLNESEHPFAKGACVNSILLACANEEFLSIDDDVVCQPTPAPGAIDAVSFYEKKDPEEHWFFRNCEEAIGQCQKSDLDFVGLNERFLGRRIRELLLDSEYCPETQVQGRIRITTPGIAGDPGWNLPFGWWDGPMGYLLQEGHSRERLLTNAESYATACTSRSLVRCATRTVLSNFRTHLTTTIGLDNRGVGLPPSPPVLRGEDVLFRALLRRAFIQDAGAHLPWMTPHAHLHPRAFLHGELFRSASSHDWSRLAMDAIEAAPVSSQLTDPRRRLESIGSFLRELGTLPAEEFSQFFIDQALNSRTGWMNSMRAHLELHNGQPEFWAADVHRYIETCEHYLADPMFAVPLDLLDDPSNPAAAWEKARGELRIYGELLMAWPRLMAASAALRAEGRGIGTS